MDLATRSRLNMEWFLQLDPPIHESLPSPTSSRLRELASSPEFILLNISQPDLVHVQKQMIPHLKSSLEHFRRDTPLWVYTTNSCGQMISHIRVFLSSGEPTVAQEAFEVALGLACLNGDWDPLALENGTSLEFSIRVIVGYLLDFPQDFLSALKAVAEFGTLMITVLLRAHGWKSLDYLHHHARSSQHLPLSYPKFLYHMLGAVISDLLRDGQESVFVTILQSLGITSSVIHDLAHFSNCFDIREYCHRCMVLHYIYYTRFLDSNNTSDLDESLEYRLSADAIFAQSLDHGSRLLDLTFLQAVLLNGTDHTKIKILLCHYSPDLWSRLTAFSHLGQAGTALNVDHHIVPFLGSAAHMPSTMHIAKVLISSWGENGFNEECLESATKAFEMVEQSATPEERRVAQWWLAFIRSNPDPHMLRSIRMFPQVPEEHGLEMEESWSKYALHYIILQWIQIAKEGNPMRLGGLLPLIRATAALHGSNSEELETLRRMEAYVLTIERTDGRDPDAQKSFSQFAMLQPGDLYTVSMEELRTRALHPLQTIFSRLRYARDWAQRSLEEGLPESIEAFRHYAMLLQDNITISSVAEHKHHILTSEPWVQHWSDTAVTAVVNHGGSERLFLSVEFLEQSKSIVYRHLFQLRQDNSQLGEIYPDLEKRLLDLTSGIRDAFQARTRNSKHVDMKKVESTIHGLEKSHECLLNEIREKTGFENFLRPLKYDDLSKVGAEGPVIMLSSDPQTGLSRALIILPDREQPVCVRLPKEASFSEVLRRSNEMAQLVAGDERLTKRGWELDTKPSDNDSLQFQRILEWLWDHVVCPIFDMLEMAGYTSGRIWWSPSGTFTLLPLHAAALLHSHHSLVSSYTPSLEVLINSRQRGTGSDDTMMPRRMVAVGLQSCPRQRELRPLSAIRDELGYFFENGGRHQQTIEVNKFEDCNAQVKSVLDAMKTSHIIHLACHGIQDTSDPLNSHLILYDGDLSLRKIMNENIPCAEFAFLSACQTATGHRELANESVHLTGGFIAAGFKGVVGTLWPIIDRDAPRVVRKVYDSMITQEGGFDIRCAAEGLHRVVQGMIKQGLAPRRWAPFIHVGI